MKRRTLAALLSLLMVGSIISPAWANQLQVKAVQQGAVQGEAKALISQEQAMEIVKKAVGGAIKPEYKSDAYLESRYYPSGRQAWRLEWRDENRRSGPSFYLSAMVDAVTGDIVQLSENYSYDTPASGVITRQEALRQAEAFIKKLQPGRFREVELVERPAYYSGGGSYIDLNYRFEWERKFAGIPVEGDGFSVSVDAVSGKITNYQFSWTPGITKVDLPVAEPEKIKEQVVEELGLILSYEYPYEWAVQSTAWPELKPVYRLNTGLFAYVDAVTGKPMDYSGRIVDWGGLRQFKREFIFQGGSSFSSRPVERKRISAETGIKKAEEFFKALGVSGQVRRSGGGASHGPGNYYEEHWTYSIEGPGQEGKPYVGRNLSVGVDVFTGQVVNFYRWDEGLKEPAKGSAPKPMSREEAQKKAEEFINKVQPGLLAKLVLNQEGNPPYSKENWQQHFNWVRLVNGIPFNRDGVRVTVNSYTGEVIQYNYSWADMNFVAPDKIISREEAKAVLLANIKPTLTYISTNRYEERPGEPVLVYKLEYPQGNLIDAASGKLTGFPLGRERQVPEMEATSNALSLLISSGVIPADASPDGAVTRRQAIKALRSVQGFYPYYEEGESKESSFSDVSPEDPDWRLIEGAVDSGVLAPGGKFNPEASIDRETLAVWAVKTLNYATVAQLPIKIELPVQDKNEVSAEARNYVGLALGLGIMDAKAGNFEPGGKVTWEELAETLVKSVVHSRTKKYSW